MRQNLFNNWNIQWMKHTHDLVYDKLYIKIKQHNSKPMFLHHNISSLGVWGIDVMDQRLQEDFYKLKNTVITYLLFLLWSIQEDLAHVRWLIKDMLLQWHLQTIHTLAYDTPTSLLKIEEFDGWFDAIQTLTWNLLFVASFLHLTSCIQCGQETTMTRILKVTNKAKLHSHTSQFCSRHNWQPKFQWFE